MESMVSKVPSAWLGMESAVRAIANLLLLLYVLTSLLVIASLAAFANQRVLDLTWVLAATIALALREVRRFCLGAMERMRQLGELV